MVQRIYRVATYYKRTYIMNEVGFITFQAYARMLLCGKLCMYWNQEDAAGTNLNACA